MSHLHYISTRNNHTPVDAAKAIALGMVPDGGLFVPSAIPAPDVLSSGDITYHATARRVLAPFLPDFRAQDLEECIQAAYTQSRFDTPSIVKMVPLDAKRSVMELWHGPTAAFKDVALQIMPHFLRHAKRMLSDRSHTVILVATSGDTGKAALEGFKNCDGVSIIVFYPHGGVSEIQKLQMATTNGNNTYVVAVKGNFDDCQRGVKELLGDPVLRGDYGERGYTFSSANSINWGRLCPQIVYYFYSYQDLVTRGVIKKGESVNFCVPTGNFGNILAGYYAKRMGLPIEKLICASNKNNVLTHFFHNGIYDSNRPFFQTMSPSMDILVSSNLERFLFEATGQDAVRVAAWSKSLSISGSFAIDADCKNNMASVIASGWVDEEMVRTTIGSEFKRSGYVLDTHTAVAAAAVEHIEPNGLHTIIASTASPYKFSDHVLASITGEQCTNEFHAIEKLAAISGTTPHPAVAGLQDRPVMHDGIIEKQDMKKSVLSIMDAIKNSIRN